jgi:hypothetical protein
MLEVGWRLLPDGSREREVLPEPQTELFFLQQLTSVCQNFRPSSAESDQLARKQAKARCEMFVNEYEAELMAIKDWDRVPVMQRSPQGGEKNAVFTTKGYDRLQTALCGVETRACGTVDASQRKQGGGKLKQKMKKKKKKKNGDKSSVG